MSDSTPKSYSSDPALYLYTSLTSGSSHIVTATSRLETILKANRIPFKAIDIATDEKARMLWGRRAGKDESGRIRKIPGLVQMGLVIGDLVEIEDWNEYGELKQHVTIVHDKSSTPAPKSANPTPNSTPSKAPASSGGSLAAQENKKPEPAKDIPKAVEPAKEDAAAAPSAITLALRQAGQQAAQIAKEGKKKVVETFDGIGQAEPSKEKDTTEVKKDVPSPVALPSVSTAPEEKHTIESIPSVQSPTSTAWKPATEKSAPVVSTSKETEINKLESIQSPNSTAWRPAGFEPPPTAHRGSEISIASKEEIKRIEDECKIEEESEDDADAVED